MGEAKTRKSKEEIKGLKHSIIEGENFETNDLNEKADIVKKCEYAAAIIREYKGIIKTTKNIVCIVHRPGVLFKS